MRFASQLSSALGPASCSSSLLLQHSISTATSSMAEKAAPKAATEAGKDGEPKKPKTDKKSPQFRQHMAEREQWRKQVAEQLRKWRGEAQVQFLASQRRAAQRSTEPVASKEAQQRLVEEAIRRAERDVERVRAGQSAFQEVVCMATGLGWGWPERECMPAYFRYRAHHRPAAVCVHAADCTPCFSELPCRPSMGL